MNKLKTPRIAVQITAFIFTAVAFFLLSYPFKFIETKEFFLTSPSLVSLAAVSAQYITIGMFFVVFFIIAALLLGRVFCGWLCPYGAVMDCFAFLVRPFKKWSESSPAKGLMSKYYILAGFLILAVLGFQFVWIFEPITVFSRFFHLTLYPFINLIIDKGFQYAIMNHGIGENLYYAIRDSVLDARQISFKHTFVFFALFTIPILLVLHKKRFWCRYICPLGASLGVLSVKPIFPLRKEACRLSCGKCEQLCRSNAIRHDGSYIPSECVMCMDCTILKCYVPVTSKAPAVCHCESSLKAKQSKSVCHCAFISESAVKGKTLKQVHGDKKDCHCEPAQQAKHSKSIGHAASSQVIPESCNRESNLASAIKSDDNNQKGISRKQFLFWGGGALAAMYMLGRKAYALSHNSKNPVIRPPGAIPEREFKQACVRCGNCMKVCVTNGLQPVMFESGINGMFTPKMDNIIGYCEYSCNACGQVCPTQAIKAMKIEEKQEFKIGNAVVVKELCVPWKDGIDCSVCEEHCPVPDKAIKLEPVVVNGKSVKVPVVDYHLCIGCGVCENKCPVEGRARGIVVEPF